MKSKTVTLCALFTIIISALVVYTGYPKNDNEIGKVTEAYQIYLDGKKIGLLKNDQEIYNLINEDQVDIKKQYNVDNVYPPNGFEIVKYNTYNEEYSNAKKIYSEIKNEKEFTIKGWVCTIKGEDEVDQETKKTTPGKEVKINVLDRNLFEESLSKITTTFMDAKKYSDYLNNTQSDNVDLGEIGDKITYVGFEEKNTCKEAYINSSDEIFIDENELTQYLLFGNKNEKEKYTIKSGDTIETVAEAHKLNTQEFLIANPQYTSADNLLAIGDEVIIALIDPIPTLVYEMIVIEDQEVKYETETKQDNTKVPGYSKVTQKGENGLMRVTKSISYISGQEAQGSYIISKTVLKEAIKEIVVKGQSYPSGGGSGYYGNEVTGNYVEQGGAWAWPTNTPYTLSSPFGYRWGVLHDAIDISGCGHGSPIYAAGAGTVFGAGYGAVGGSSSGLSIGIDHGNGYYTVYAHLSKVNVSVGQKITRGQKIGAMGNTGTVSPRPSASRPTAGTHLHFGVFQGGLPYSGGRPVNPLGLYR